MNFDFALKNIDDSIVSLDNYPDAKGFIIVFTCNHCPYAIAYEERIKLLSEKYLQQDYPLIAINPNDPVKYPQDSFENMKLRAADKGFNFPYLFDETQEIAQNYGAEKTPHTFILKRDGIDIHLVYQGAIDDNYQKADQVSHKYVEDVLDALSKGKQVPVTKTNPVGCSVKWR